MRVDKRELKLFEKEFYEYVLAGAIWSYGDVIDFVEGEKQGIVLIDTCGHLEEFGIEMGRFIRKEIESGWGVLGDARDSLEGLARKIVAMKPPGANAYDGDEWYDYSSGLYAQFDGERLSLSMAGGLGYSLFLRESGSLEKFLMKGSTLDGEYSRGYGDPAYNTSLQGNDLMLLQSDGFFGNLCSGIYEDVKAGLIEFDTRFMIEYVNAFLLDSLGTNIEKSPIEIRDSLIENFGKYFIRKGRRFDDVTFVVVKRK